MAESEFFQPNEPGRAIRRPHNVVPLWPNAWPLLVGAAFAVAAMASGYVGALAFDRAPDVRLVAYGCEGAGGPLYATEESDFPRCDRIEPVR